jgi:hypothetical protein
LCLWVRLHVCLHNFGGALLAGRSIMRRAKSAPSFSTLNAAANEMFL